MGERERERERETEREREREGRNTVKRFYFKAVGYIFLRLFIWQLLFFRTPKAYNRGKGLKWQDERKDTKSHAQRPRRHTGGMTLGNPALDWSNVQILVSDWLKSLDSSNVQIRVSDWDFKGFVRVILFCSNVQILLSDWLKSFDCSNIQILFSDWLKSLDCLKVQILISDRLNSLDCSNVQILVSDWLK